MPRRPATLIVVLLLALTILPQACGHHARVTVTPTSPTTPTASTANSGQAKLAPRLITKAYTYQDENTVNIYLSNLTPAELARTPNDEPLVGQIVHIHMFIRPDPGRTPIEPDALNTSIRHAILAPDGATGIYAGGGFLLPKSKARSGSFEGTISRGTLTLQAATPNFNDALGPASLRATFDVPNDTELANLMATRFADAVKQTARR
ncbi:MAG: hypothetical protein AAFR96_09585 [Planctomycetota bacterium]